MAYHSRSSRAKNRRPWEFSKKLAAWAVAVATMRRICGGVACAVRPLRPAPTGLSTARTAGSVSTADRPPSA